MGSFDWYLCELELRQHMTVSFSRWNQDKLLGMESFEFNYSWK